MVKKIQNKDKFNFFVPASFEEGMKDFIVKGKKVKKNVVRVKGIASTATAEDTDGETLFPDGFDYAPLLTKGFLNWDHQQKGRPSAIVGEPDVAKVINGGKDFYIEGYLYPDSAEAQQVAELAEVLEKNSPTRRLGYSIEGQVIERGCGPKYLDATKTILNPEYNDVLWRKVLKARITGVAITPCPKNPNTLLSLMKGEYSEAFIESDELEDQVAIDIEKGGVGSGRKYRYQHKALQSWEDKHANLSSEDHEMKYHEHHGEAVRAKEREDQSSHDWEMNEANKHKDLAEFKKIQKAMSAEGASDAGLLPEHIEGTKNPNKYPLDEDESHTVARSIKKSDIYNLIVSNYTTDLVKAKKIFQLIKSVNQKLYNMTTENISQEAIDKAFDFLNKASEEGIASTEEGDLKKSEGEGDGDQDKDDSMEKAKTMCKSLLEKGGSQDNAVEEMIKSGISLSIATTACATVVSEMSNLKENGGEITSASPANFDGKDQPLKKGEESASLIQSVDFEGLLEKSLGATNDLIKGLSGGIDGKFDAVGKILKHTLKENELLKGQLDELKTSFSQRIENIEKESVPTKSARTVKSVERFEKSESTSNLPVGTNVYSISNREDREALLDILDGEVTKSRMGGGTPSKLLENTIANLEMAKTVLPESMPLLRALNIAVDK